MSECLVKVKNGNCKIFNPFEPTVEINFKERVPVKPIEYVSVKHRIDDEEHSDQSKLSDLIKTDNLNKEEKFKIIQLCSKFRNIFYHENSDLTFTNSVMHTIRTKDDNPIYVKSFRHPQAMRIEIQKQIERLLDQKIIRPSISPYSAPVWIVPKKKK